MNGVVLYVPVFSQYFLLALTGDAICDCVNWFKMITAY